MLSSGGALVAHYFFAVTPLQAEQAHEAEQTHPASVASVVAVNCTSRLTGIRICFLRCGQGGCSGYRQYYYSSQNHF
jgi:hypothetical protein